MGKSAGFYYDIWRERYRCWLCPRTDVYKGADGAECKAKAEACGWIIRGNLGGTEACNACPDCSGKRSQ